MGSIGNVFTLHQNIPTMINNTTTVHVLENNLKPATHFIEVYKIIDIYQSHEPLPIKIFDGCCKEDSTIAIFKIRMKPQ